MQKKRILALGLSLCMFGGLLAGCGAEEKKPETDNGTETTESLDDMAAYFAEKDHYTIKVMCFGDSDSTTVEKISEKISEYTEEALNCDVEITRMGFANYMTQLNMDLSSGEEFDLFIPMAAPIDYVNAGQIQPITDLIPEFAPNLNAVMEERDWLTNTFDGDIYGLPNYQNKATVLGVGMRKDICDELGIDYENMSSWDDYHDALVKVKNAYPDMYPIASNGGNMFSGETAYTGQDSCGDTYNLAVLEDPYDENGKVQSWFETEQFAEVTNRMYEWAQEGLIQPDASTSTDDVNLLVASGKAFFYFQHTKPGWEEEESGKSNTEIVCWRYGTPNYIGYQTAWFVPTASGDPERAVAFYDMMYSNKEISNLVINGLEGENYVFANEEKTVITYPDGVDPTSTTYMRLPWEWANGSIAYPWDNEDPALWEEYDNFGKSAEVPVAFGFNFDATAVMNEVTACVNVYQKYVPALLCGSLDPETTIPKLNEEMKAAGIEKIVAEKQRQLDEYLAGK